MQSQVHCFVDEWRLLVIIGKVRQELIGRADEKQVTVRGSLEDER